MIILSLLSSEPFGGLRLQGLLGPGSDIVMEIITLKIPRHGSKRVIAGFNKPSLLDDPEGLCEPP